MKTARASATVRRGKHHINPPASLPCVACGINVPGSQVKRNRELGVYDNLCGEHAKDLHARVKAREQTAPVPSAVQDGATR